MGTDSSYELAYLLGRQDAYMDRPLPRFSSCSSPASPSSAGPAAGTPREGGGTAGGVSPFSPPDATCCHGMFQFLYAVLPYLPGLDYEDPRLLEHVLSWDNCPWCWERLFSSQTSLKGKPQGRPSEGFESRTPLLKRVLRRLWPVGTPHRQRRAERR